MNLKTKLEKIFFFFRHPSFNPPIIQEFHHSHVGVTAFGVGMNADHLNVNSLPDFVPPERPETPETVLEEEKPLNQETSPPTSPTSPASKAPSIYESIGAPQMVQLQSEADFQQGQYEPKIAESNSTKSRGSILVSFSSVTDVQKLNI